jgi:hypothetical protein
MARGKTDWVGLYGNESAKKSSSKKNWVELYGDKKKEEQSQYNEEFYNKHPYIKAIGEGLTKVPGLETAGNAADFINRHVEAAGIPHAARGFFQGGEHALRGVGNALINGLTGVKLPGAPSMEIPSANISQNFPIGNGNPNTDLQSAMEIIGEMGSLGKPTAKIFEGTQALLKNPKIPQYVKNLISGTTAGSLLSPDHRVMGGAIGAGFTTAAHGISKFPELKEFGKKSYENISRKLKAPGKVKSELESAENEGLNLANESELAGLEHEQAKEEAERLKSLYSEQYGKSTPETLGSDVFKAKNEIKKLEPFASQKSVPMENLLPGAKGENLIPEAETNLQTRQQQQAQHEEELSGYLGRGQHHAERAALHINPILERNQAEIGKGYDAFQEGLKNKHVTIPNTRDTKTITHEIQQRLSQGDTSSPEITKLMTELEKVGSSDVIPADEFMNAYRTLRRLSQKTRSSAYGKSQDEFARIITRADEMDADVDKMEGLIETGFKGSKDKNEGKKYLEELNKLNSRYKNEVVPLFKNEFFHAIQKGKAPTNMMESLTGEPHIKETNPNKITGQQILNNIFQNDPELLRLAVGQRYAENPANLHNWNEVTERFTQNMPELQERLANHRTAMYETQRAEQGLVTAKQQKAALDTEAKRIEESDKIFRAQEKQRVESQQQISKLSEEIRDKENAVKKLRDSSKNEKLSYKEKIKIGQKITEQNKQIAKLDKELKAAKTERNKIYKTVSKFGIGALTIGGVKKGIDYLVK